MDPQNDFKELNISSSCLPDLQDLINSLKSTETADHGTQTDTSLVVCLKNASKKDEPVIDLFFLFYSFFVHRL